MKYLLENQETTRLTFRPFTIKDFDALLPLFDGENVIKFLGLDPKLSKKELCEFWFNIAFNRYKNDLGGMNALIHKKSGTLIGASGILVQDIDGEERFEIGYSILPQFWGMGYATEAAFKCKNFAFEHHFSDNLMSMIHVENIGSERVALKNSMQFEVCKRNYEGKGDFNIFSINKNDWLP